MFVGKSILASFMLSTAVMVSSPEGTEISDSRINATVLVVSEKPEEAMVSGMPETSETESSQSGTKEPERGQQQETKNSMAAQDTEEPESEEEPEVSQDQEDLSEETGSEGDEEFEVSPMTGTAMTMLSSQGGAQMLSSVIRSQNGSLVVVDGGWEADGGYLVEHIKANGGVVDAWLITHPHSDHAGALYDILKNRSDEIEINRIYYSFAPVSWYEEVSPEDVVMVRNLVEELDKLPQEKLCDSVGKGYKITVDNLQITAMNDRYQLDTDPVNNSSITYMVDTGEKKVLFLGDMSYDGGSRLGRECGDSLKADIVQMAHHGQNGVGRSIYQSIAPKICLWPTPQWLWDNDNGGGYNSGPWKTVETRGWMNEILKVDKNYCIKDGDIVLQLD